MVEHIPSPAVTRMESSWLVSADPSALVSHWSIIDRVAVRFKRRYAIARDVKRDLLIYAGQRSSPIFVGVANGRRPFPLFATTLADTWLAEGGREWILAELEARSGTRVIAFPGGRSA